MTNKLHSFILAALIVLLQYNAQAQKTYQLPNPSEFTSAKGAIVNDGSDAGNLYYGAVPSNAGNKPVLLFVHGYNSSSKTWWDGNDMYSRAFGDGYRTAFASLYPDRSMWANGEMLKGFIDRVTAYYGVSRVVIVAHSKGGVDSDAALVHYGAFNKVERVITLGSPHFGTQLADLAHSNWASWLANVFGQTNEGTFVLQTGYMNYFRSVTDPHPNRPRTNFRTFGAWGYSGVLWFSGVYLNWNSTVSNSGGNDGVVPYYSTKRPNSAVIFGVKDSRGKINHDEVHKGNKMWQHVRGQLPSSLSREVAPTEEKATNPNAVVFSSSQIISADKGGATFQVEPNVKSLKIEVFQSDLFDDISIFDANNNRVYNLNENSRANETMMGGLVKVLEIDSPTAGTYKINSEEPFVALVTAENGVKAIFSSDLNDDKFTYQEGEAMNFKIKLEGATQANVTGTLVRTGNLEGVVDRSGDAMVFELTKNNAGEYVGTIPSGASAGVYSVNISAKGSSFERNIATSIAVTPKTLEEINEGSIKNQTIGVYPNPSRGNTTFSFEVKEAGQGSLTIFDMTGRQVKYFDLSNLNQGFNEVRWDASSELKNGLYIYELNINGVKETKKLILSR